MTNETHLDPRKKFAPRTLPWLLAAAMLAVYAVTLNHWVSLLNVGEVSRVSGYNWQPELLGPLSFLVTYPFRWLPVTLIPAALNFFSAICGAAALGLLARSVAILPQDRTEAQRKREKSDFSFLTTRTAWLPPMLAAAVCGLQLTFWEQATNQTGETFDLLLFAFVIWSLLEYRLDERVGRLYLAALVYGAGMAEDWGMIAFLPVFIVALIWTRKFTFFNLSFLGRMILLGLAGLSFYLLLPLIAVFTARYPLTFWQALTVHLSNDWQMIGAFFQPTGVRHVLALLSLTSLLPVFLLSIRWSSSFGDRSHLGQQLATYMFHFIHALMLGICVWVAFDPPLSPRHLGFGMPCLTLYYLGALAVGYYSGYFLLVFGREPAARLPHRRPKPVSFPSRVALAAVFVFATIAITGLVYKNAPQIHATNNDTLRQYANLTVKSLPQKSGYILSDDPLRLVLVQTALAQAGRTGEYVPLDTQYLSWPGYHRFLHEKHPKLWPDFIAPNQNGELRPMGLVAILSVLSRTNDLYYLHPSFGYYFEQFYAEPHGLVYKLKPLPANTLVPPLPDQKLITENETFWADLAKTSFPPLEQSVAAADPNATNSFGENLLTRFHVPREPNRNAIALGSFYSRDLDFWGVQLQRAGQLPAAAAQFQTALQLNPNNVVARINLDFNQQLQAGQQVPVDLATATSDQFGKYTSWDGVLGANGPFDQPSFCFQQGLIFIKSGLLHQAILPFERVTQFDPGNLDARYLLGQIYLSVRRPDQALAVLQAPLTHPEQFSLNQTNATRLHILLAGAYLQKNENAAAEELLQNEIALHPDNDELLFAVAKAYTLHGLYTNALDIIDRKLQTTPDDPAWLFSRGYVNIQTKHYPAAVTDLTRVLSLQSTNNDARFNRAIANLDAGNLADARADYQLLQATFTNSPPIAYGLGEIAWREHDTNEAIRNYQIYLANANTNTAEATNIMERLRELKGPSH